LKIENDTLLNFQFSILNSQELSMFPTEFQYFAPTSVAEAISLLQQHGDEAKILGAGIRCCRQ